jgi:hypothetical protein
MAPPKGVFPGKGHWAGPNRCGQPTKLGQPCQEWEIDGLDACLRHVPDELLDEAEELTGERLCRHNGRCSNKAVAGSDPARCVTHGMAGGGDGRKSATMNLVEGQAADRLAAIMTAHGEKLMHPDPIGNPLDELLALAAEIKAGKELLREAVQVLWSQNKIRYAHSKAGEQLRVEILLYERALERFGKILVDISKLKIEDRLAGIRQQTADMIERALDDALEDSGVGLEGKAAARATLGRRLHIVKEQGAAS